VLVIVIDPGTIPCIQRDHVIDRLQVVHGRKDARSSRLGPITITSTSTSTIKSASAITSTMTEGQNKQSPKGVTNRKDQPSDQPERYSRRINGSASGALVARSA
jgi:hypothetical protein